MIIGLCGPLCAGKTTIAQYLVDHLDFQLIADSSALRPYKTDPQHPHPAPPRQPLNPHNDHVHPTNHTHHRATNASLPPYHPTSEDHHRLSQQRTMEYWKPNTNLVIDCIHPCDPLLPDLLKRPFFLLVYVDAPLLARFARSLSSPHYYLTDLQSFAQLDDRHCYRHCARPHTPQDHPDGVAVRCHSPHSYAPHAKHNRNPSAAAHQYSMARLQSLARLRLVNVAPTVPDLVRELANVCFMDDRLLRPGWDSYFMRLAQLASERTNCIKRRVGCVIARNRRVVATGYNGTASGLPNCNAGGCARCSGTEHCQGERLDLCFCLHAEENAIIEAGRERCEGSTLYTNLFPCVLCAKKMVQAGVARVVFDKHYTTGGASERLLSAGGVKVDSFDGDDGSKGLWEIILTCD